MKRKSSELAAATPSKVPNLRPEDETTAGAFDYSQVDFQKMFSSNQKSLQEKEVKKTEADFDPNRSKRQDKRRQGGGKPKQRMKGGGGVGLTFNKK
jgi:hypothetical protein